MGVCGLALVLSDAGGLGRRSPGGSRRRAGIDDRLRTARRRCCASRTRSRGHLRLEHGRPDRSSSRGGSPASLDNPSQPSAPAEIQGYNQDVVVVEGAFDPEAEYGTFPDGVPARPESLLARAERKRGISVPSVPCPSLVIASSDFPDERGRAVADLYGSQLVELPHLGHFDLVLHAEARAAVADYLGVT